MVSNYREWLRGAPRLAALSAFILLWFSAISALPPGTLRMSSRLSLLCHATNKSIMSTLYRKFEMSAWASGGSGFMNSALKHIGVAAGSIMYFVASSSASASFVFFLLLFSLFPSIVWLLRVLLLFRPLFLYIFCHRRTSEGLSRNRTGDWNLAQVTPCTMHVGWQHHGSNTALPLCWYVLWSQMCSNCVPLSAK